jgi:hypothetical protein
MKALTFTVYRTAQLYQSSLKYISWAEDKFQPDTTAFHPTSK